ncbi:hypothetical protein ACMFMG_001581 [Clarireedia jacksonii]
MSVNAKECRKSKIADDGTEFVKVDQSAAGRAGYGMTQREGFGKGFSVASAYIEENRFSQSDWFHVSFLLLQRRTSTVVACSFQLYLPAFRYPFLPFHLFSPQQLLFI